MEFPFPPSEKTIGRLLAVLAGILTGFVLLVGLGAELNWDEAEYLTQAMLLAAGRSPYDDWVTNKPPGIHLVLAPAIALFGNELVPLRCIALGWCLLTALLVHRLAVVLSDQTSIGRLAVVLWLAACLTFGSFLILTEPPCIALGLAALLVVLGGDGPPGARRCAAAGALLGLSGLFKQIGALSLPGVVCVVLMRSPATRVGLVRGGALAGVAGLVALTPLAWCALRGIPGEWWQQTFVINLVSRHRSLLGVYELYGDLARHPALWLGGAAGMTLAGARALRGRVPPAAAGLALVALFQTATFGRDYAFTYVNALTPVFSVLSAWAIATGLAQASRRLRTVAGASLAGLLVCLSVASYLQEVQPTRTLCGAGQRAQRRSALELAATLRPGETLFVQREVRLYFLTGALPVHRAIHMDPIFSDYWDPDSIRAALEDPRTAVWLVNPRVLFSIHDLAEEPWRSVANQHYRREGRMAPPFAGMVIFRRRKRESPP